MADGKRILGTDGKFLFDTAGEVDICEDCCDATDPCSLPTCGCDSGNSTYPRMKVTLCWTDNDLTKTYMGCTWNNGQSKIVCPDTYNSANSTTTVPTTASGWAETWIKGTASYGNTLSLKNGFQGSGSNNFTQNYLRVSGGGYSDLGTQYLYLFNWHLTSTTGTNKRTYTSGLSTGTNGFDPSTAPLQGPINDAGIQDGQFGHITNTNGITIKWEPISGAGQTWSEWRKEADSVPLPVANCNCNANMQNYACDKCGSGTVGGCDNCCSCKEGDPDVEFTISMLDWQASHSYVEGDRALSTGTVNMFRVASITGSGVSGGTEPSWDTVIGNTTVDNDVTWERLDNNVVYLCGTWDMATENGETRVICPTSYATETGNLTSSSTYLYNKQTWAMLDTQFGTGSALQNLRLANNAYYRISDDAHYHASIQIRLRGLDADLAVPTFLDRSADFKFTGGVTLSTFELGVLTTGQTMATKSDFYIRDTQFGSVTQFGITYTWAKGNNWPFTGSS